MKRIILTICVIMFYSNISYAEKVECELLSPIQKSIYKAYCQAEAKKMGNDTNSKTAKSAKSIKEVLPKDFKEKTGGWLKKLKLNTDSTLLKTGKHAK
jgi:hypothetical protein